MFFRIFLFGPLVIPHVGHDELLGQFENVPNPCIDLALIVAHDHPSHEAVELAGERKNQFPVLAFCDGTRAIEHMHCALKRRRHQEGIGADQRRDEISLPAPLTKASMFPASLSATRIWIKRTCLLVASALSRPRSLSLRTHMQYLGAMAT